MKLAVIGVSTEKDQILMSKQMVGLLRAGRWMMSSIATLFYIDL